MENISKGSSLCPFGSSSMRDALREGATASERAARMTDVDIHGYDEKAPDTDDEALSDLES